MKKLLLVVLTWSLILSGCGQSSSTTSGGSPSASTTSSGGSSDGKKYVFKIGHTAPASDNINKGAVKFSELVAQKTNNRIKIEVYPDSQLGNPRTLIEGMQTGTQEMVLTGSDNVGAYDPAVDLITMPYLWKDPRDLFKVLEGPVGDQLADHLLKKTGIRNLAYLAWGQRQLYTDAKHPVKTPEDLKGLKIRVPEAPVMIESLRIMGAAPTPMPYNDVYTAIQTGVINGFEGTPSGTIQGKLYEITPNMAVTSHIFLPAHFLISEKLYQTLPADLQKAVTEAAKEAAKYQIDLNLQETKDAIEQSSKYMKVYNVDQEPYRKAAKEMWYKFEKERGMNGFVDQMIAAQK